MKAERGLTLIEVLISVAILAATIMSVFTIYTQCIVEIRRAKNRTLASHYAQMMMEMIASSPHSISHYHGLTTQQSFPQQNSVRDDMLKWAQTLQTFPGNAVGAISVTLETYSHLVTVEIAYQNYGRETTSVLKLKMPGKDNSS